MTERSVSASKVTTGENVPFWKRLFAPGGFEWAFRMRKGDAQAFFAPQDSTGTLLKERNEILDHPSGRYLATTTAGEVLTDQVWDLALELGQVKESPDGKRDLLSLSRQWEADLVMMDISTKSVAAGSVCFPSSWDLAHVVGKTLDEVHEVVPKLNPQIGEMINRFVQSLSPGKSFCRENWSFTRTADLDYHPAVGRRRLDESLTLDEVFLRIEHQIFTGLPDGVLMGVRIETFPLKDLATDPDVWRMAYEKLQTMPEDVANYKSMDAAIPKILEVMEAYQPIAKNSRTFVAK